MIKIEEKAILIRINKTFKRSMDSQILYDYTRGRWRINTVKAKKASYAIAVFKGVIQEVYEIEDWHKAGTTESSRTQTSNLELNSALSLIGRFEFIGKLAPTYIREKYNQKSVSHYFARGNANPINYVNL
jgi:hypothetical protein